MSPWDQWIYRKYRFDHHFFCTDMAPPPIEMWTSGIFDINSVEAQQWFHDRNIREMMDEWSDSSDEEQTAAPPPPPPPPSGVHYLWFAFVCFLIRSPPPTGEQVSQQCTGPMACKL